MKINQFALYRVNKMTAGRKLWHLSYNEVREKNFAVRVEFYQHMMVGEMGSSAIIRYYCYIPCTSTLLQATACHIFHTLYVLSFLICY